jgi:hypothetical protein
MGYSSRYHVASLAAVFLALGVGILIGTGLKSVVSDATRDLESSLRGELSHEQDRSAALSHELGQAQSFEDAAYPGLVRGLLHGRRVAVVVLGEDLSDSLHSNIDQVVGSQSPTGAEVQEFAVVREPPDVHALAVSLRPIALRVPKIRGLAKGGDPLTAAAERAGRAIVKGGGLYQRVQDSLLRVHSGSPSGIDAVIVVRTEPTNLDPAQADATNALESGLLDGLASTGLPVVGVELTDTDPSSVGLFSGHGLSSVDDLDLTAGQVALAYGLRGSEGSFGVKSTADRLLPPLRGPARK